MKTILSLAFVVLLSHVNGSAAHAAPELSMPLGIPADAGQPVTVPVTYTANGNEIAGLFFSVDFDETNLDFDPTSTTGFPWPDAITVNPAVSPFVFSIGITYDATDTDSELDFAFNDLSLPFTALPEGELVTITFTALSPSVTTDAPVNFSQVPVPSFGNTAGQSVAGVTNDGSVRITTVCIPTGTPETVCNGVDDDCDGFVDEDCIRERIELFVTRFYEQCLNRLPDGEGLDFWVNSLIAGSVTGADVARGFVFSQEFLDLNTTNEDYLTVLYRAFFNRDPDSGGQSYWLSQLNSGVSREDVLDGFITAQEFIDLCDSYGIIAFRFVDAFVTRFYEQCLNRSPDSAGLAYWVDALVAGSLTGADVAWGFVFSPEFTSLKTTNGEYVTVLYRAFFDRPPDPSGMAYWLDRFNNGASRQDVLNGFIYAQEFADLCDAYGIRPF